MERPIQLLQETTVIHIYVFKIMSLKTVRSCVPSGGLGIPLFHSSSWCRDFIECFLMPLLIFYFQLLSLFFLHGFESHTVQAGVVAVFLYKRLPVNSVS